MRNIGIYVIVTGLFLTGTFGVSQIALADQVELQAEKDNTIYEEDGAKSCGACGTFIVGTNGGDNTRRALIEFDVSSIPANSTVTNVEFEFVVTNTADLASAPMDIHRVNVEWGEAGSITVGGNGGDGPGGPAFVGDATWTDAFYDDTVNWSSAGGDFLTPASGTIFLSTIVPQTYTTSSNAAMVADVQAWVDNSSSNHGWELKLNSDYEDFPKTARAIDSRTSLGTPPLLRVIFIPPVGDSDADGVPDDTDNCINDANPNQYDSDNDGIGDVCDTSTDVSVSIEIDDCHEFGGDISITNGALMTFTTNGKAIIPSGSSFNVSSTSGALLVAGSSIHISNSVFC